MPETPAQTRGLLGRFWHWLKKQWVEDVPEDIAACEFECRKDQCLYDEWASCQHRLPQPSGEAKAFAPPPAARP